MKNDFVHVRAQYFGADPVPSEREVVAPGDPSAYDSALFIRQLRAADLVTDGPARTAFFNAEVMTRDINERESVSEVAELRKIRATVEQLWSTRFEAARDQLLDRARGRLPGLYPEVCTAIEQHHGRSPSALLRDSLVHRIGLVHHLAEDGRLGWVAHFEEIVADHREGGAGG